MNISGKVKCLGGRFYLWRRRKGGKNPLNQNPPKGWKVVEYNKDTKTLVSLDGRIKIYNVYEDGIRTSGGIYSGRGYHQNVLGEFIPDEEATDQAILKCLDKANLRSLKLLKAEGSLEASKAPSKVQKMLDRKTKAKEPVVEVSQKGPAANRVKQPDVEGLGRELAKEILVSLRKTVDNLLETIG